MSQFFGQIMRDIKFLLMFRFMVFQFLAVVLMMLVTYNDCVIDDSKCLCGRNFFVNDATR